jgi:hypothetical protein
MLLRAGNQSCPHLSLLRRRTFRRYRKSCAKWRFSLTAHYATPVLTPAVSLRTIRASADGPAVGLKRRAERDVRQHYDGLTGIVSSDWDLRNAIRIATAAVGDRRVIDSRSRSAELGRDLLRPIRRGAMRVVRSMSQNT